MTVQTSLIRTIENAVRLRRPSSVMIGGSGTVSVYPEQDCYVTDIQDWESVYTVQLDQIRLTPALWEAPPRGALPLEELRWRAAYHAAQAEVAASGGVSRELVHLVSWPNLTRLPEELIAPITRICALLWRKPTVGFLVARMLDLPNDRAAALLQTLQVLGHVAVPDGLLVSSGQAATAQDVPGVAAEVPAPSSGLMSKLWQRLLKQGA